MDSVYAIPNDTMAFHIDTSIARHNHSNFATINTYDQFYNDSAYMTINGKAGISYDVAMPTIVTNTDYSKEYSFDFTPYTDSILGDAGTVSFTINGLGFSDTTTLAGSFSGLSAFNITNLKHHYIASPTYYSNGVWTSAVPNDTLTLRQSVSDYKPTLLGDTEN